MKLLVVHPKATCISARKLAKAIGADTYDLRDGRDEFFGFDLVWNYGATQPIHGDNIVNRSISVQRCVDKVQTFEILRRNKIPTVDYTIFKHNVPDTWESIVIRDSRTGRKAEGLYFAERGEKLRDGELYTEYFPHIAEYRVVVMMGRVVGRYRKDKVGEDWLFTPMHHQGFEQVDWDCERAADAIGIDYVGFDVLENAKGDCVIIEGNSGAMMQDEALEYAKNNINRFVKKVRGY